MSADYLEVADVLRHFFGMEMTRDCYAKQRQALEQWLRLDDEEFLSKMSQFHRDRKDDNPALDWTVGSRKSRIASWTQAHIPLGAAYSCGISSSMRHDLDLVKWNLQRFLSCGFASKYPEFRLKTVPETVELRTVIAIRRDREGRDGRFQVIDGAHRIVAMLAHGISECPAYVAQLKSEVGGHHHT